ncbi:MAG: hypothetical protein ABI921_12980 [Panacibacter sp.]
MRSLFIIIFFITATNLFCSAQYMQLFPGNTGTYGGANSNDLLVMGQSDEPDLEKADISGNPFWNEAWKTALIYTDNYKILISQVKLNLYKNDVWYVTPEGTTMVAKKGQIKAITFFNGEDTTSVLANFVYMKNGNDRDYHYYQVLNGGKSELVKLNKIIINKSLYDPFTGTTEMNYKTEPVYYLYHNADMPLLKSLNKEAVFEILNPNAAALEWLNKNRNKLKSESDIIQFLNYFNTHHNK